MLNWEEIAQDTYRLKVYGGWMVTSIVMGSSSRLRYETAIFVPDPSHQWSLEDTKVKAIK